MYRIKVIAPITARIIDFGYFVCCYRCRPQSEDGLATFICYAKPNDLDGDKIKIFKTYKEAKKKLEFLKEKINKNGYMWHWKLEIEEIKKQ